MSNESTAVADRGAQSYKLPVNVQPERYEISLAPDLAAFTFTGSETIIVSVKEPTDEIVLNALDIEIHEAGISNDSGISLKASASFVQETERAYLKFPYELSPGIWKLSIKFSGILNDKLHGFYRSSYTDEKGNQKVIATTQFEATDARRAFPCWDEPEHKAVFSVKLTVDDNLTAISNARIISEIPLSDSGKKEVTFACTIKMSTYLVAFIVGDFECSDSVYSDGVEIRVFATPGKKHLTSFALDCAKHCVSSFAHYYGIPYPGDKMDMIAIPDFAAGAMENLGAITFRETALLVDRNSATHAELERVADVVAHEIAHMWFGDLVTMKWWNGLWLNEAFATFMEMLAVDAWKPHWRRWETFGVSRAAAFAVDSLRSTRTIEYPVRHPDEAAGMFDILTYEKGASVLRMLEQYLEPDAFRCGIKNYLKKHEYANAETTDLWDAIEESAGEPVRKLMDTWIFQEGYPLVSVEVAEDNSSITLCQERFCYLPVSKSTRQLFQVPVIFRAKTATGLQTSKVLLSEKEMVITLKGPVEWIVVNAGGHGFYRVRYASDLLDRLTQGLFENLEPIERFNLISDAWASCLSGHTDLSEYIKLLRLFSTESDKNVWAAIIGSLSYLSKIIDKKDRSDFEGFVRSIVNHKSNQLGWEPKPGEDDLTCQLRGMLKGAMGTLGQDKTTQITAADYFSQYKKNKKACDPNIVPALISILSTIGDQSRYDEFHREFQEAKTPQEEQRYLFSLAGFRSKDLILKTLEKTTSGEVRTQNAPYLVQATMHNPEGGELAWEFVKKNWDTMVDTFPANALPRMCEGITSLVSPVLEKDVNKFFASHQVKQAGKTIDQHLEKLKVAVAFKKREGPKKSWKSA